MSEEKSQGLMDHLSHIRELLLSLQPETFEMIDESPQHAKHHTGTEATPTHLRIKIWSPLFEGKSRIEQHRMVQSLLKTEFDNGLHALTLVIQKPSAPEN